MRTSVLALLILLIAAPLANAAMQDSTAANGNTRVQPGSHSTGDPIDHGPP